MQRWHTEYMLNHAVKQFNKIARRKQHAHINHEIHFLRREVDNWLPEAVARLTNGTYDPLPLKRLVFADNVVDQLSIPDRVLQNLLLNQLKPTLKYTINPRCYHLLGPNGVKVVLAKIRDALATNQHRYFIRMDIKSFYASISRKKLVDDISAVYDNEKVCNMLSRIINNPIEVPNGIRNPDNGIALRGPLSQFFGALYLKPLDDALSEMDVFYARYNDDCLLLCKSKRQLVRAKRKIYHVLRERRLTLSSKKSRTGSLDSGFHFLGAQFLGTQRQEITAAHHFNETQESVSILTGG